MKKRVLVFGSYVADLCSRSHTFPRPGETVKGCHFRQGPGGKGSNQAIAASRAGASVTFVTKLGDDLFGRQILDFYRQETLDVHHTVVDPQGHTGAALIMVDEASAQNQIIVVGGACETFTAQEIERIVPLLDQTDILLTQMETNMEPVCKLLKLARQKKVLVVLNPAPAQLLDEEYLRCVDILTPNETEAEYLTGIPVTDQASASRAAHRLLEQGVGKVVITMGKKGAYICSDTQEELIPCVDCGPVVDTTGAGDAFTGGLVAALADGKNFAQSVHYGSVVAGLAVTRQGTSPAMPYREEIEAHYAHHYPGSCM